MGYASEGSLVPKAFTQLAVRKVIATSDVRLTPSPDA
jgi:hypothetical protein